jgi:hypothetical protein
MAIMIDALIQAMNAHPRLSAMVNAEVLARRLDSKDWHSRALVTQQLLVIAGDIVASQDPDMPEDESIDLMIGTIRRHGLEVEPV